MPRVTALVMAVIGGFLLPAIVQAASAGDGDRDLRLTALFQDLPIQEALEAVGLLAGRQIEVMGPIEDRKVSVTLNNATLSESIYKVLSPSNYVVVLSDQESVVVLMLEGIGDPAAAGSDSQADSRDDSSDDLVSIFRESPEVIPPSHPDEEGLTSADIEYYWSFAPDYDPSEVDVIPPTSGGEDGFTEQDLADLLANQQPDPLDSDFVPRDSAGHSVMILQHVETLRSATLGSQPSEVALWPSDEGDVSDLSITIPRDSMKANAHVDLNPESLADFIPPD